MLRLGNFNPRSREGSDDDDARLPLALHISILAPARGATVIAANAVIYDHGISILAPARGATAQGIVANTIITDFNPRSREGSDSVSFIFRLYKAISILAPARGATR